MRRIALICVCFVTALTLTSCVLTYKLNENAVPETVKTEENVETVYYEELPDPQRIEYIVLDTEEHVMTTVDTLPDGGYRTVTPLGNNPTFYVYDNSLTIYGFEIFSEKYSVCTLNIPEGYTDAEIMHLSSGAGSGEVEMILTATKNSETVYLSYLFYAGNEMGYLCPVTVCELNQKPDYIQ
ncbi:MAG: hypothetical protein IJ323_03200 [Clostridia bacterium]|nr:hypothetical protein [Clostridia bacterium]